MESHDKSTNTPVKEGGHGDALLPWWLAAGIVGADIGTSVFYSTGVIKPFVGFTAPLVILFVCLMMWFFKATYEEGCSASPFNGGAYMMVLQTVGRRVAMVVGALTILSYLATAAVSALSGAYYIDSFDNIVNWPVAAVCSVAIVPVIVFGLLNIVGIKEPAIIVFGIAFFHFVLLLGMDVWGLILAFQRNVDFGKVFQAVPNFHPINYLQGIACAFLGITGFESAAQIVEQLKSPTWRTLKQVYLAIVLLVGITAPLTSYLCIILLTNDQLDFYSNSLLSGLAYVEGGTPLLITLVVDAALTLFAAVNTAYVGCIGLCTTMAKQGNLPAFFLRRWAGRFPMLQGYPYVVLLFMAVTVSMILVLPGQVDNLGQVYGMAFLAVMISFCVGVLLLRVRMPLKVARAPYRTRWVLHIGSLVIPMPPAIGITVLLFAQIVLVLTAHSARALGLQIFTLVLLLMAFYRLGVVEERLSDLADLRLGLGQFKHLPELPEDLPTYVLCTGGAKARNLASMLLRLLAREEPGPKEVIIFHAEEEKARRGVMYELLQRVVSQQIVPEFEKENMILTVKVMPETLIDGLIQLKRAHPFKKVFIGTGSDPQTAQKYAKDLETNLGVHVVNIGSPSTGGGTLQSALEQSADQSAKGSQS
ncbi:MAG: APC family permease [Candidatus Obscuribacterales bacterium]|nr:APC family permease [Candidatus Obscuribacterales bacterium]